MGKKSKKRKAEGLEKHKQIKRAKKVEKKKEDRTSYKTQKERQKIANARLLRKRKGYIGHCQETPLPPSTR
jgi:hypothetical protein